MMPLAGELTAPPPELLSARNDPDDVRLGETVARGREAYDKADVVIVGYPEDEGVRRNDGRTGASAGPKEIRRALYALPAVTSPEAQPKICDLGNIRTSESLEETHAAQNTVVRGILQDDKLPVVIGGGNDVSYPDVTALAGVFTDPLVFNIDSHFDVRRSDKRHSGTSYRQLLDEGAMQPKRFFEMAVKPDMNAPSHLAYLREVGANVYPLRALRSGIVANVFRQVLHRHSTEAIFWGFDLDAVRASDAPGVSSPFPTGLTAEEICEIAEVAGNDSRSRMLEITEMNPRYDIDGRTATLAAMMISGFLRAWLDRGTRG
jgi:formiminoglutamase